MLNFATVAKLPFARRSDRIRNIYARRKHAIHMRLRVSSTALPNPFKYAGSVASHRRNGEKAGDVGAVYFLRMDMRPLDPLAGIVLHFPIRRQAWALSAMVFGYRAAQNSGTLDPRGGQWSSRRGEFFDGALGPVCPRLDDMPSDIHILGRIPRRPPHATIAWMGIDVYQKL